MGVIITLSQSAPTSTSTGAAAASQAPAVLQYTRCSVYYVSPRLATGQSSYADNSASSYEGEVSSLRDDPSTCAQKGAKSIDVMKAGVGMLKQGELLIIDEAAAIPLPMVLNCSVITL